MLLLTFIQCMEDRMSSSAPNEWTGRATVTEVISGWRKWAWSQGSGRLVFKRRKSTSELRTRRTSSETSSTTSFGSSHSSSASTMSRSGEQGGSMPLHNGSNNSFSSCSRSILWEIMQSRSGAARMNERIVGMKERNSVGIVGKKRRMVRRSISRRGKKKLTAKRCG
jgi:hypothetical protein